MPEPPKDSNLPISHVLSGSTSDVAAADLVEAMDVLKEIMTAEDLGVNGAEYRGETFDMIKVTHRELIDRSRRQV